MAALLYVAILVGERPCGRGYTNPAGGDKRPSQPYEFIGLGAMDVTKPYKFIWFGDIHGPEPYTFIGLRWAFISQTPVLILI